jgi:hypothetical protein
MKIKEDSNSDACTCGGYAALRRYKTKVSLLVGEFRGKRQAKERNPTDSGRLLGTMVLSRALIAFTRAPNTLKRTRGGSFWAVRLSPQVRRSLACQGKASLSLTEV